MVEDTRQKYDYNEIRKEVILIVGEKLAGKLEKEIDYLTFPNTFVKCEEEKCPLIDIGCERNNDYKNLCETPDYIYCYISVFYHLKKNE